VGFVKGADSRLTRDAGGSFAAWDRHMTSGPGHQDVCRVVALGASNLTRGFQTVVSSARAAWGPGVEVVAALGHGRSYGADSHFLVRRLPSILESGLWRHLESAASLRTRALVTDVGNDILYGFPVEQILGWVDEALRRLQRYTGDIVLTGLPMASARRLSRAKFRAFTAVVAPSCRLSLDQVLERAERVNEGLAELAEARRARLFRLEPSWYGFDPIHIRPALWRTAWSEILGVERAGERSATESLRLYLMRPERQWFAGVEQVTPQTGAGLRRGGHVWLY
jgi:hypothetical protein